MRAQPHKSKTKQQKTKEHMKYSYMYVYLVGVFSRWNVGDMS
jgi:hypothetical protein